MVAELIRYYGGAELDVPLAKPWRTWVYAQRGMKQAEIALRLGSTRLTVWRQLNQSADQKQAALPF